MKESYAQDPALEVLMLTIMLLSVFLTGIAMGAWGYRGNTITRRIELRALQYFLLNPPAHGWDTTVESIVKRQIRRLENRLNIDNDE